mgnify:CR=1 FL=1
MHRKSGSHSRRTRLPAVRSDGGIELDKHRTRRISNLLAIIISAFFAAVGVAGFQRTGDMRQLLLFIALAAVAFGIVKLAFFGINRLLDKIE